MKNFKKNLKGNVDFQLCKTLKNAINSIFKDIKKITNKKVTVLLSPASASYDQFKNFEERGNYFKNLALRHKCILKIYKCNKFKNQNNLYK